jgi:hypothetical protein
VVTADSHDAVDAHPLAAGLDSIGDCRDEGLIGVDVYSAFGLAWVAANLVFGLLVIVIAIWVSRAYADRLGGSPLIQRLLQDVGGQNLAAARTFVKSVSEFAGTLPN